MNRHFVAVLDQGSQIFSAKELSQRILLVHETGCNVEGASHTAGFEDFAPGCARTPRKVVERKADYRERRFECHRAPIKGRVNSILQTPRKRK
jgi:hypothetical protein